jgi:hypothetical protein
MKIAKHCKVKIHDPRATDDIWKSHNQKMLAIFRPIIHNIEKIFQTVVDLHTQIHFMWWIVSENTDDVGFVSGWH